MLSRREGISSAVVGFALTALVFYGFLQALGSGPPRIDHARSMALTTLCLASATLVAGLSRLRTPAARWIVVATLALNAALVEVPFLAHALHVTPLHAGDWTLALIGGLVACLPIGFDAVASELRRAPMT